MRQLKLLVLSLLCITAAGGAALKAAGTGVNVTKAITAYDIAGNTVMSTQAGVDMVENGVDAQNALQLLAGIGGTGTAIYSNKSVLSLSDIETPALQVGGVDVSNTTTLYRAVSKDELLDVADNGFRLGPNAMGNKWFAESAGDASEWGKKFFKWDKEPVFTMEVKLPNSVADKFMRNPKLDGIGPARSADADLLKLLNKEADVKVLNGNVLPSN